eukprot:6212679-Pleurochrysis_carterae.AAC.1
MYFNIYSMDCALAGNDLCVLAASTRGIRPHVVDQNIQADSDWTHRDAVGPCEIITHTIRSGNTTCC